MNGNEQNKISLTEVKRWSHTRGVSSVKFSPCGTMVASASSDKTCAIYNVSDFSIKVVLEGHKAGISDVSWSGDSRFVCTASDDTTMRIWEGELLKTLKGHNHFVMCNAYNPPSNLVASGCFDETVRVWDVKNGNCLKTLPAHSDPVTSVQFNRDGSLIATASYDGLCRIWDTSTGQCLKTLMDDTTPPVSCIKFTPNSKYLLVGRMDDKIKLWDYSMSQCLKTYQGHVNKRYCLIFTLCYSDDEQQNWIVSGSEDNAIYFWDIQTKDLIFKHENAHDDVVIAVDCHLPSKLLASCSLDGTVKIWKYEI